MTTGFIVGGMTRTGSESFPVMNPYTGEKIGDVWRPGEEDIRDALRIAGEGAKLVRDLPAFRRAEILHRLADLMEEGRDEYLHLLIAEAGKVKRLAEAEVTRSIETIRISAEEAVRMGGDLLPLDRTFAGQGRIAISRRFPVGIVLAITPFNFPLNLACHKVGPAIASGNACILKPSSKTPLISLLLGEMILRAGYPKEAVHILPCTAADAGLLTADHRIRVISFTGSPEVGWDLARHACGRVALELGGNAAVILHEDADLEYASSRIVEGGFSHAGQVCISVQRVFIHRPVYEKTLEMIVAKTRRLCVGDPEDPGTDVGPMISLEAAETAVERIRAAVRGGAILLCGGDRDGTVMNPAVLTGTTPDMDLNRLEMFAPVITVTPYDTFKEAIDLVNGSVYGLQAGVFTQDIGRAFQAFRSIETGAVIVNDIPTFRVDMMPYGGVKSSGIGREGPRYAIEEMTEERMMVLFT